MKDEKMKEPSEEAFKTYGTDFEFLLKEFVKKHKLDDAATMATIGGVLLKMMKILNFSHEDAKSLLREMLIQYSTL